MKASQLREFSDVGVIVGVMLQGSNDFLEIDEKGILAVPAGVEPTGFHLLLVKPGSRTFFAQKHVGEEGGAYHRDAIRQFSGLGLKAEIMRDPIEVVRVGKNVWTSWHQQKPNRVDCWQMDRDGHLGLFQIGVFTHDNGKTWKLHGEFRWKGRLYRAGDKLVGLPDHPNWGSLEGGSSKRSQIFDHPEFVALLKTSRLSQWRGSEGDLNPQLPQVPGPGHAVVQWYITFAGQSGMGPVNLHMSDGKTGWIHGCDIQGLEPDSDGEIRLWPGDVVTFEKLVYGWGSKKDGPPKLIGVRLKFRRD